MGAGGTKRESTDTVEITSNTPLYAHWTRNYYAYTCSPTNGSIKTITASVSISDHKIAYGAAVKIQFEGNNGYALSSVTIKETNGSKTLSASDITLTENGGTKVYVQFTMPDYPVTITPTFKPAYKVKITPLTCTYDGSDTFVKRQCWNEDVRIWIASNNEGSFDTNYKQVTLDNNAEYDGYILLPDGYTSLTSPKVCAMTVNNVGINNGGGQEEHGFGSAAVSSNQANITMNILNIGTTSGNTSGTVKAHSRTTYPYNTIDPFGPQLGFKYSWVLTHNNSGTHTFVSEDSTNTINSYTIPTDKLQNGSNGIRVKIKVAGLEVPGGRFIFNNP